MSYVGLHQDQAERLLQQNGLPTEELIDRLLRKSIFASGDEMNFWLSLTKDSVHIDPELLFVHREILTPTTMSQLIHIVPEDVIQSAASSDDERALYLRVKAMPRGHAEFILKNKDRFADFFNNGKATLCYFEEAAKASLDISALLTDDNLAAFSAEEKAFWLSWHSVADQGWELKDFLLAKPRTYYLADNGTFKLIELIRDFINEVKMAPENCRSYENLTALFNWLQSSEFGGEELGMMLLRIAAAHRVRNFDERTGIEAVDNLRQNYARIYRGDMTAFELICWKILQRQLPFTADEGMREAMRNKAVDVEHLNPRLLSWVHQSVHNYASTQQVEYLKAFRSFLQTGDQQMLAKYRTLFSRDSQAPNYTDDDRNSLRQIPNLASELDLLTESTSLFYEIRPETLQTAVDRLRNTSLFADMNKNGEVVLAEQLMKDANSLKGASSIQTVEDKQAAVHFCLNVGLLRKQILQRVSEPFEAKTNLLILDAVLDDFSQKIFTKYKDYLSVKGSELSSSEILEAVSVFSEVAQAAYFNGEMPRQAFERAGKFRGYVHPDNITFNHIQAMRMTMPIIKQEIDEYWKRFMSIAQPEMVSMLIRTGMTEKDALERVIFTDLVEFKKSSMIYVLEPMMNLIESGLEKVENDPNIRDILPKPAEIFREKLGEDVLQIGDIPYKTIQQEGKKLNGEVKAFIDQLVQQNPGESLASTNAFLVTLGEYPEAKAEALARVVKGYLNAEKLVRTYTRIERPGKTIELYPITYYGCDMVIILENGRRITDPVKYLESEFSLPKVVLSYQRQSE